MARLEQELRREIKWSKINKAVFTTVAVAGAVTVAVLAPNVIGALGKAGLLPQRNRQIKSAFGKLLRAGYIRVDKGAGGSLVRLTQKGESVAARMGEGKLVPKKPSHWDMKWRILMFDIPERRRRTRRHVRQTLMNLGFYRLQDSVWVYPYDCEELIIVLKADLKIGKDLLYVIADKIERDALLRAHFGL